MSQVNNLRKHLEAGKAISPLEARHVYGIESLPRRILDVKERYGLNVIKEMHKDEMGKRYARYHLA